MASASSVRPFSLALPRSRCGPSILPRVDLRICESDHPPLFTRRLFFAVSALRRTTASNDRSPPNPSFKFNTSVPKFRGILTTLPPIPILIQRRPGADFLLGFCAATLCLIIALRIYAARRFGSNPPGTVADLVRRGQLRSDRRGISEPMKYDDPFDNPVVKVSRGNSTVEMCGKVYRMAPVTLTEEQQSTHQRRRSRAYQWKRPKVFLKEGDDIPTDVDPDTIRWIPANHPFATTASDIDEDLAQNNVRQKHGVPFRIRAEHEAMQKKLEALQKGQKLNNFDAEDFEKAFKFQATSSDAMEQSTENAIKGDAGLITSDRSSDHFSRTGDSQHDLDI